MRIAFLIMAHCDPQQLERLVKRLNPNEFFDSTVFLHIDAKSDINLFKDAINYSYVKVTSSRVNVIRCGISQVLAELELMKSVLESGEEYDRCVLITGQDYPVMSNEKIFRILSQNQEYMRCYKVTGSGMNIKLKKYYFYNQYLTGTTLKNFVRKVIQTIMRPLSKKDTVVLQGAERPVYYSSAYFAVSLELLRELYEIGIQKKYFNYFKTAICADEMYFATIAANGKFKNKLQMIDNPSHNLLDNSAITFFDYQQRPITLTKGDYCKIKDSGRMFARKFASEESRELMDFLDKENM